MLGGAAAAGVGLTALTACGSNSSAAGSTAPAGGGSSAPSSTQPSSETSSAGGKQNAISVPVADVPVGGGKILAKQQVVVTQPTAGHFKAFSAICTHQGCIVGAIADKQIVCPCHGSKFSIADGSVTNGPAATPLPPKSLTKNGADLTVS